MKEILSEHDEQFIDDLLEWYARKQPVDMLLCNMILVLAGAIIVLAALATLARLTDRMILGVLVPGLVIGMLLVGVYILANKRIKERRRVAQIMEKLMRAGIQRDGTP